MNNFSQIFFQLFLCFVSGTLLFQETILMVNDKVSIGLMTDKNRMVWGSEMKNLFLNISDPFVAASLIRSKFKDYMQEVTFNDKIDEQKSAQVNKTVVQQIVRYPKYLNLSSNQLNFTNILSTDYKLDIEFLEEYLSYFKQHFMTDCLTVVFPFDQEKISKISSIQQDVNLEFIDDGVLAKVGESFLFLAHDPQNETLAKIQNFIFQTYFQNQLLEQDQNWTQIRNKTISKLNQIFKKELQLTLTSLGMFELKEEVEEFYSTANFFLGKADLWWSSGKYKQALEIIDKITLQSEDIGDKLKFLGEYQNSSISTQNPVTIIVGIICLIVAAYQLYYQNNLWSFYKKIV